MCSKECSFNVQCIFSLGNWKFKSSWLIGFTVASLDMLNSHTKKSDATVFRTFSRTSTLQRNWFIWNCDDRDLVLKIQNRLQKSWICPSLVFMRLAVEFIHVECFFICMALLMTICKSM